MCEHLRKQITNNHQVINNPIKVALASDKLAFFKFIKEQMEWPVRIPDWTEDQEVAKGWINSGKAVVCRTVLNGHSGEGIVLAERVEELVKAPLYTLYVPKKDEYRIHVFNGEVLHVSRKARNRDIPNEQVNWKIRNHGNGFIFQHFEVETPGDCEAQALGAVAAVGLDFGAVDVIYNDRHDRAYVLEINTAPGIEGVTLEKYVAAINRLVNDD